MPMTFMEVDIYIILAFSTPVSSASMPESVASSLTLDCCTGAECLRVRSRETSLQRGILTLLRPRPGYYPDIVKAVLANDTGRDYDRIVMIRVTSMGIVCSLVL
ncbi:hypothetical protein M433DRAFT_159125 [Acidomyces richmondensis BFW]|nr:hypothetical protein M433DRAFT_159125 [Acidomyces richmondensis BFW]